MQAFVLRRLTALRKQTYAIINGQLRLLTRVCRPSDQCERHTSAKEYAGASICGTTSRALPVWVSLAQAVPYARTTQTRRSLRCPAVDPDCSHKQGCERGPCKCCKSTETVRQFRYFGSTLLSESITPHGLWRNMSARSRALLQYDSLFSCHDDTGSSHHVSRVVSAMVRSCPMLFNESSRFVDSGYQTLTNWNELVVDVRGGVAVSMLYFLQLGWSSGSL